MYAIVLHAHQKLDRVARRHLGQLLPPDALFPTARQITHFEGSQGPDGANLKRQKNGEQPWHFVDPYDVTDTDLNDQLTFHYDELVKNLRQRDRVRAAFDAAWLAHALVDGLTPAHHYPYEQELADLRGGQVRHTRKGLAGRLYVKADTIVESVQHSLKLVGPGGLLTNHAMFEAGAYTIIVPLRLNAGRPSSSELEHIVNDGIVAVFNQLVQEVAALKIYDRFMARGWTYSVSRDVRRQLAPRMVRMITLAWYAAYHEAASEPA